MRSFLASRRWLSLVYILSASVLAPSVGEAALLSVTPSSATVNAGDTVTLDIVGEDVTNLGYIQFALDFDAALLSPDLSGLVLGDFLSSSGGFLMGPFYNPSADADTMWIRAGVNGATTPAGAPRTVVSLAFVALTPGVSPITLAAPLLIDTANRGSYMIGEGYDRMAVEVNNGSVDVVTPTAVPEPSTILLTMTGLGASWSKRRRARA